MKRYVLLAEIAAILIAGTLLPKPTAEAEKKITVKSIEFSGLQNVSTPSALLVPKINLTARIEAAGLDENNIMVVPVEKNTVSWYKLGVKPGELGRAVIAGHFEWTYGAGVFRRLGELQAGDLIIVKSEGSKDIQFEVKERKIYDTDDFPIDEIYGNSDQKRLNLITCWGIYNKTTKAYPKRLVIFSVAK